MSTNNTKKALIVIDVQQGFISDYTKKCLPHIHALLKDDEFEIVIATRFYNRENSPFRRLINWHRLSSSEEIRLDETVAMHSDYIIDKPTYGAGEQISDILNQHKINKAVIVGIDTDVCVLQNAAYLFDHNFEITVDTRGCATNGGVDADKAAHRLLQRTLGRNFVI